MARRKSEDSAPAEDATTDSAAPADETTPEDEAPAGPAYDDSDPLARAERSKAEGGKHF